MKHRYLFSLLIVWLVICSSLFSMIYTETKEKAISALNSIQMIHAEQAKRGIEDFFRDTVATLTKMAASEHVITLNGRGRRELDFALSIISDAITAITRVDAEGRIVYSAPFKQEFIGRDISWQDHIQRILKTRKAVVSDVFTAVQGYRAVALHVPLFKENEFYGTLGVLIDFESLAKRHLQAIRLGETGYAWMTSKEGIELYCPVPGHTGRSVFENCKNFPTIIAMANEMVKGRQGVTTYTFDQIRDKNIDTIRKQAVYLPIKIVDTFWTIVVASSENEVLATLANLRDKLIFVFSLLFCGSICFSYYGMKAWGIVREEAKRKEAQTALRESEERYRSVTETVDGGIVLQAASGEILTWNKGAEKIFGIPAGDVIGQTSEGKDWPTIREDGSKYPGKEHPSMRSLTTGKPCRNEIMGVFQSSGELHWISVNANPLFREDEKKPYAVAISFSDITSLKTEKDQSQRYLDVAGVMLLALNTKGEITLVNKKACEILESDEKELLGKNWFDHFLPRGIIEDVKTIFRKLIQGDIETVEYVEGRIVTRTGRKKTIAWHNAVLSTDHGKIIGTLSSGEDITERKQAEDSLRYERDLMQRIMETSPAGITRVDTTGRIVYANRRAEAILGMEPTKGLERTYNDPAWKITDFGGNRFPEDRLPFAIVKKTGKPVDNVQHAIEWPDGRKVFLSINAAPLVNASGAFDGMVATIEDITEKYKAEQHYQVLFREMIDGFAIHEIICDDREQPVDYRFLAVNPAFERLTGKDSESLIGKTVMEVWPNTEPYWIEKFGKVALTGEPATFENYSIEIDRYFQVTAFRHAKNQFACIFVDISGQKQAEADRIRLQTQLANAVEIAHLGHWEYDVVNDRFTFNDQFYKIFHTTAGKVGGYTMTAAEYARRFVHPDDRHVVADAVRMSILATDPDFRGRLEHRMIYADGSTGHISVLFFLVKDAGGRTIKTYGVNQDISERKRIEERLQQAQKMEAIGSLAGGIAHDFNNLLFPIVGMAEMLMEDLAPESLGHGYVREIYKAGQRASELVKQILAFSRRSEHQMIPVRPQQVLREVLKLSRASIPSNIEISHSVQSDCGMVLADPTQVHQVVMNLITNAYHAVEAAGGKIELTLNETVLEADDLPGSLLAPGRYARLCVADTGCGIAPEIMDKIFEPYFTTKEQGKGTGLGLALVYGIVKEHKGDIKVHSEMGRGTTFEIHLPLLEKAEAPLASKIEIQETGDERILLVDDEVAIARLVCQMLERLGYRVTARTGSREALVEFRTDPKKFDLVITDMAMPHMTGDRLAREIIAIRPDIPIIICTGFSERIDQQRAQAIGIKGFLMKPVVKSELARMVRKVLDASGNSTPPP